MPSHPGSAHRLEPSAWSSKKATGSSPATVLSTSSARRRVAPRGLRPAAKARAVRGGNPVNSLRRGAPSFVAASWSTRATSIPAWTTWAPPSVNLALPRPSHRTSRSSTMTPRGRSGAIGLPQATERTRSVSRSASSTRVGSVVTLIPSPLWASLHGKDSQSANGPPGSGTTGRTPLARYDLLASMTLAKGCSPNAGGICDRASGPERDVRRRAGTPGIPPPMRSSVGACRTPSRQIR